MSKCITIHQPLAWGVVQGWKKIENRGKPTKYRGPLWIHAGKSRDSLSGTTPEDWREDTKDGSFLPGCPEFKDLVFGAILGVVDLVDCVHEDDTQVPGLDTAHTGGPWCYVLDNARPLKNPILNVTGQLGIWNYDLPEIPEALAKGLLLPTVPYRGWSTRDEVWYAGGKKNKGPNDRKAGDHVRK